MIVWAIASQKGGVGKTTTVASLAGWLQLERQRVLVIDTDPHASLTSYLGFQDEGLEHNLYDLYAEPQLTREQVLSAVTHTRFNGIDLIASTMTLATIDRQLSGRVGVGRILLNALNLVDDCYDVVLIDCPPVLGALMVNALVAATLILVPTQTEFLALKGLEGMVRTFHIMHNADPNASINYLVVPTMFDKRTKASTSSLEHLNVHYHRNLWDGVIPIDTLFRESSSRGLPIPLMDETCRGSLSYRELLLALISKELEEHPDRVSPSTAAILTIDDADEDEDTAETGGNS
ncbi:MAG: ParA family protein [Succinivibrio sp.]|nr:ParA family protein [Succinivibrio sp.]